MAVVCSVRIQAGSKQHVKREKRGEGGREREREKKRERVNELATCR